MQITSPDGSVSSQDHSPSFYTPVSGQSSLGPKDVRKFAFECNIFNAVLLI